MIFSRTRQEKNTERNRRFIVSNNPLSLFFLLPSATSNRIGETSLSCYSTVIHASRHSLQREHRIVLILAHGASRENIRLFIECHDDFH